MRVAVTGASGYIGSALSKSLLHSGHQVVALVRQPSSQLPVEMVQLVLGDFAKLEASAVEKAFEQLRGFDALIHTAAMAHSDSQERAYLDQVQQVNVEATAVLSRAAERVGIRRFIFLSSIGVNGSANTKAFSETDKPHPHNFYAQCKYEAEQQLLSLASDNAMEVVIVRPPMVYSQDAPGNFAKLIKLVKLGMPLPFKHLHNQRSVIALDNLLSFLVFCANQQQAPQAKNQVFLIADKRPISTKEMVEKIASSLGLKARMVYISPKILLWFLTLVGKQTFYTRLFGSLQIGTTKAERLLGWQPSVEMSQQLEQRNKRVD